MNGNRSLREMLEDPMVMRALRILEVGPATQDPRHPLKTTLPLIEAGYARSISIDPETDRIEITALGLRQLSRTPA